MININLLPPAIKLKIKKYKQSANILSICLVVVIVTLVTGGLLQVYRSGILQAGLENEKSKLETLNNKLKDYNNVQQKAVFINDRAELATSTQKNKPAWSQIIQDLINAVPSNVQVTSLSSDLTKNPNFLLQGLTDSERDAIKFKDKLESSTYFKDVSFKSSSKSSDEAESKLNFSLEFNLETKNATSGSTK